MLNCRFMDLRGTSEYRNLFTIKDNLYKTIYACQYFYGKYFYHTNKNI